MQHGVRGKRIYTLTKQRNISLRPQQYEENSECLKTILDFFLLPADRNSSSRTIKVFQISAIFTASCLDDWIFYRRLTLIEALEIEKTITKALLTNVTAYEWKIGENVSVTNNWTTLKGVIVVCNAFPHNSDSRKELFETSNNYLIFTKEKLHPKGFV